MANIRNAAAKPLHFLPTPPWSRGRVRAPWEAAISVVDWAINWVRRGTPKALPPQRDPQLVALERELLRNAPQRDTLAACGVGAC